MLRIFQRTCECKIDEQKKCASKFLSDPFNDANYDVGSKKRADTIFLAIVFYTDRTR